MNTHIVCDRWTEQRILPRLSRILAEQNSWSISDQPNPGADLNYFFNYITWIQKYPGWNDTPTAAYFSHYDEPNKAKADIWRKANDGIDYKILTADRYADYVTGNVYRIKPPVEIDCFVIAPSAKGKKPIVGVSGFTYGDGRKGEDLIKKLVGHKLAKRLDLRASGRGWAIPTRFYKLDDLHKFFQSLDVLVVPSIFEGIPMPPLEALACGVKVVIPRNVGLLDELPDIKGIYRYECGDAEDMIRATDLAAFDGDVDRQKLRKIITENYTPDNWASEHQSVFEDWLYNKPIAKPKKTSKDDRGVYMVAFGAPSRKCAVKSIASIKKHMPGLSVCLVSDRELNAGEDVFIDHLDSDIGGRIAKLKMDELAPKSWRYVLYMDADVELLEDISFYFKLLEDGFEFVICKDMNKYATIAMMHRPDNLDECKITWDAIGTKEAMQYNGGMMAFSRNDNTHRFFELWKSEWDRFGKRDQGALIRALYQNPLRMNLLMNQWNASDRYPMPQGKVAVLHHNVTARRWTGRIPGRIDEQDAWSAVRKWEKNQVPEMEQVR